MNNSTIDTSIELGADLTTVKVRMKYPTNRFTLYAAPFHPMSLAIKLALELKCLQYRDLEYVVKNVQPHLIIQLQPFIEKTACGCPPYLRVEYRHGRDETWLVKFATIARMLDVAYPLNSLLNEDNPSLTNEISIFNDWLLTSLGELYDCLLLFNPTNLRRAQSAWLGEGASLLEHAQYQFYLLTRKHTLAYSAWPTHQMAVQRLDEEVLPLIADRLEQIQQRGLDFLVGAGVTMADLTLYAYLHSLMSLDESSLVMRRLPLLNFMRSIESVPLNKSKSNSSKEKKTRKSINLIEVGRISVAQS